MSIVTDRAINEDAKWDARQGDTQSITINFSVSQAARVFTATIYRQNGGATMVTLSEANGKIVNNGTNIVITLDGANAAIMADTYEWKLKSDDTFTWFCAPFELHGAAWGGDTTSSVSFTVNTGATTVDLAITIAASHFRGVYATLVALQAAVPTGNPGDYADVDAGAGTDIQRYIWDDDDEDWILGGGGGSSFSVREVTTHTILADSDTGTEIQVNSAVNTNITVPAGLAADFQVIVRRIGTGSVTFVEGSVAVNIIPTAGVLTDAGQNVAMALTSSTTADEYYLDNGQSGVGTGDVVGPASATNNAVPLFDGTTGKLLKNSSIVPTAAGISMINAADAAAQTALLDAVTSGAKGLAPASGGGSTNYLRADGTWAAPPGTGGSGATKIGITICGAALTITNIPMGVQELSATRGHRVKFDCTGIARIRLSVSSTTGAASGGVMYLEYSTDDATYVTIGAGSGGDVFSLVTADTDVTSWITMPSGAQADVWLRAVTSGGNGADDPIVRVVVAQLSTT